MDKNITVRYDVIIHEIMEKLHEHDCRIMIRHCMKLLNVELQSSEMQSCIVAKDVEIHS